MNHHPGAPAAALTGAHWLALVLTAGAVLAYFAAANRLWRKEIRWPVHRLPLWTGGCVAVAVTLAGPLADRAHHDFTAHMLGHLLLGMLAPLLLVLAAPVTLLLRVLPVRRARQLSAVLSSPVVIVLTNPVVAAVLNLGGLWLLYRTNLTVAMRTEPWLHLLVHGHLLAAGYLFTAAVLGGPDPAPHRLRPAWRAGVLVLALAAHNVLAKSLYGNPPPGVSADQAQAASQLMYYGAIPVELTLLVLVCRAWAGTGWVCRSHEPDSRTPRRHRRFPAAAAHRDQGAVRRSGDGHRHAPPGQVPRARATARGARDRRGRGGAPGRA
ncbi:cytochrome c oxidase assembly protein [Amycolatopsis magusensis]|uniref:cytochrome c oxidase assembly protein n=1 Tax=Amycolatopsis magusensis TaxID=882444 RepID=UPI0037AF25A3